MSSRWLVVTVAAAAACGSNHNSKPDGAPDTAPDAAVVSMMIGPAGGTVMIANGPSVNIPANALDHDTMITITASSQAAPAGAVTPVYDFGPDGTVFAQPVVVTFQLPSGTSGSLYWSKHGGGGFDRVGGTVSGDVLTARTTHFSSGYVGPNSGARTISGIEIATFINPAGIKNQPFDLSALAPRVLAPDGSGGFTTITGNGASDGTFSIDGVPDGDVYVQLGTSYYVTSATAFDGGYEWPGRPDAVTASPSTAITLSMTGLDPWAATDVLEAYSAESDSWYFGLQQTYVPGAGATTLGFTMTAADGTGTRLPPFADGVHVVQASKGDHFAIAQLTQRQSTEGTLYEAMTKYFDSSTLEQTDGGTAAVSGTFTDVSATNTLSQTLLTTQFDAAAGWNGTNATKINPGAVPVSVLPGPTFSIIGIPGGSQYGEYSDSADFLYFGVPNGTMDTTASNMTYGTPSAGTWAAIVDVRDMFDVPVLAPGTTTPGHVTAGVGQSEKISDLNGAPFGCGQTAVRSPTVAGADAFAAQSGVGLTPTIAWQAPQAGVPSWYGVAIYEATIVNGGTKTKPVFAGQLRTTATSVQLPPGLLQTGHYYFALINANRNASTDYDAPNRFRLPSLHAQIVTAVFSP